MTEFEPIAKLFEGDVIVLDGRKLKLVDINTITKKGDPDKAERLQLGFREIDTGAMHSLEIQVSTGLKFLKFLVQTGVGIKDVTDKLKKLGAEATCVASDIGKRLDRALEAFKKDRNKEEK